MSKPSIHSAVFIIAYFVTLLLNYIFGVTLSWFITPTQFGILGVAQSLLLLIALVVGSGFAWTTNHDLAIQGLNDVSRRRFRTAFIVNIILGFMIAILLWISYETKLLNLGTAYKSVIPLVSITAIFLSARAVLNGAARGLHKFSPVAMNLVVEVLVKIMFGILLVMIGVGVSGVMFGFALGAAVSLLHSIWITRKANLWQGHGWLEKRVIKETLPIFIGMIGVALMLNLDVLGLKLLAPTGQADEMAGYYQAAAILARAPVYIAQAIILVLFSYVAKSSKLDQGKDGRYDQSEYLENIIRTWYRLLLPISIILVFAPASILSIFFPPEYRAVAPALRVAGIGSILLALITLLNGYLQASGNRRTPAVAVIMATLLQIILMITLIPDYGIMGTAISLLVGSSVALVALLPAVRKQIFVYTAHIFDPIHKVIASSIPIVVFTLLLVLLPNYTTAFALMKLIVAGVIYVSILMITQRQITLDGVQPTGHLFSEFVRVFLGG